MDYGHIVSMQKSVQDKAYNQAISDVLAAIEDTNKVLTDKTPKGITVVYKETLKNVIKSLKK